LCGCTRRLNENGGCFAQRFAINIAANVVNPGASADAFAGFHHMLGPMQIWQLAQAETILVRRRSVTEYE
jgi:hypothetical protein